MAEPKLIGLREIRALAPGATVWDAGKGAVAGFGARRQSGETVTFVLKFRTTDGRQRWHSIGRWGSPWTPDAARTEAKRLLGGIVDGADPVAQKQAKRAALKVSELCDRYLADAEAGRLLIRGGKTKKPSTLAADRGMIESHIKPLLGRLAVVAVSRADIDKMMHDIASGKTKRDPRKIGPHAVSMVRGGRGVATRTVGLLGAIFTYAMRKDLRTDNPVRGVQRPADGHRERRLTDDEYRKLGNAMRAAALPHVPVGVTRNRTPTAMWPAAVAITWFLAFSGWRSGEALTLRWRDVDLVRRTATLPDTKTGKSMRPLSHAACDVLSSLGRSADNALVFAATRGDGPMSGFRKLWNRIAKLGDLPADVTPHVLRHSFASLAADLGYSEPTIGALIGHKGQTITSRYVHSAAAVLLAAADAVATEAAVRMGEVPRTAAAPPLEGGASRDKFGSAVDIRATGA